MAAGPGVSMQGSPATELTLPAPPGGNQTHLGEKVKTEEVTGKNVHVFTWAIRARRPGVVASAAQASSLLADRFASISVSCFLLGQSVTAFIPFGVLL